MKEILIIIWQYLEYLRKENLVIKLRKRLGETSETLIKSAETLQYSVEARLKLTEL